MVSPASAKFIDDRLKQCNKSNYEIITYPGAGHLLEPPYAPFGRASFHIVFSKLIGVTAVCERNMLNLLAMRQ